MSHFSPKFFVYFSMNKFITITNKSEIYILIFFPLILSIVFYKFVENLYPLPQLLSPHDLGIFLDSAWRLLQGQLPHRDYISSTGIVWAYLTAIPVWISGASFNSYKYFPPIVFIIFFMLTIVGSYKLFNPFFGLFIGLFASISASATHAIGSSPELLTFSTSYNRIGFSILFLVGIFSFAPDKDKNIILTSKTAVINAILVGSLFFLKLNFALVAFTLALFGCINHKWCLEKKYAAIYLFCLSATITFYFWLIDFDFISYLRDMSFILSTRKETFLQSPFWIPGLIFTTNIPVFILLSLLLLIMVFLKLNYAVFATLMSACGSFLIAISQGSGDGYAIPGIIGCFAICVLWIPRYCRIAKDFKFFLIAIWIVVISAISYTILFPSLKSLLTWYSVSKVVEFKNGSPKTSNNPYETLVVAEKNNSNWGSDFSNLIEEAISISRKNVDKYHTLQFVDFTNFLNFGLFKSPKGQYSAYDRWVNFSLNDHANAQNLFIDTDFLLICKRPISPPSILMWQDIYGKFVSENFYIVDQSNNFILLKKITRN